MSLEALKRNGHNLDIGAFELAGEYGIPVLQPVHLEKRLEWMRFNHAMNAKNRDRFGVHFFMDDFHFQRVWHDPTRYMTFLTQFPAVMSPDFSMFADYPKAVNVYNHWRKHQLAAYWQRQGITVVPSVSWVDRESWEWCFDGEPVGGTVAVSSVGTQKNPVSRVRFVEGYKEMLARLRPEKVIFFGKIPEGCEGNIEYHAPYYETFTEGRGFSASAT